MQPSCFPSNGKHFPHFHQLLLHLTWKGKLASANKTTLHSSRSSVLPRVPTRARTTPVPFGCRQTPASASKYQSALDSSLSCHHQPRQQLHRPAKQPQQLKGWTASHSASRIHPSRTQPVAQHLQLPTHSLTLSLDTTTGLKIIFQ